MLFLLYQSKDVTNTSLTVCTLCAYFKRLSTLWENIFFFFFFFFYFCYKIPFITKNHNYNNIIIIIIMTLFSEDYISSEIYLYNKWSSLT